MEKRCDLHSHSTASDGTMTPSELVALAKKQGLSALALTDHNTTGGLKEFMEAGKNSSVITVPGCEFTTEWHKKEVHVVGLFFREEYWREVDDFLELVNIAKANSNAKLINSLAKAGYEISLEEVVELAGGETFNRSHVARILVAKGYFESTPAVFDTVLKEGNGFYVPAKRITSTAAVRFIKNYGATAIIAHPLLNLTEEELREFLPEMIKGGLDAIETEYTEFTPEMKKTAVSLAEEFSLKQSGGSDYHGAAKPWIELGKGRGNLFVPFSFYENMKACSSYDD